MEERRKGTTRLDAMKNIASQHLRGESDTFEGAFWRSFINDFALAS
jgi:hypothetical protein